jgi:hypothetical protein
VGLAIGKNYFPHVDSSTKNVQHAHSVFRNRLANFQNFLRWLSNQQNYLWRAESLAKIISRGLSHQQKLFPESCAFTKNYFPRAESSEKIISRELSVR